MHPVVLDVLAVEATLITEILLKLLIYIITDGLPAGGGRTMRPAVSCLLDWGGRGWLGQGPIFQPGFSYHSELLTASPKPGVSTMVSFNLTPFSSMSTVCFRISTVWLMRSAGNKRKALFLKACPGPGASTLDLILPRGLALNGL